MTKDGKTISYSYNADGIRTEKNNNGVVTKYFYDSNNNLTSLICGDTQLVFYYDVNGQADSFVVHSGNTVTRYYYVRNLQGDITKIMSSNGTVVANYYYGAYGEILSITNADGEAITDTSSVALLNPLRYRGYVYDNETGFYYLQSRYYDPIINRFVNADSYTKTETNIIGANMYAYCASNPVVRIDNDGEVWVSLTTRSIYKSICATSSIINYWYNIGFTIKGAIYNQKKGNVAKLRFGFYKSSYNGCGWIATYNALIMLGKHTPPYAIIAEYELNGAVLNGTFGIRTDSVVSYFATKGYKVTVTTNKNKFDSKAKSNTANIIFYFLSTGAHYVALKWDGKKFRGYNTYRDSSRYDNWGESIKSQL